MVQELRFVLVEMPACREGMKYSFVKGDSGDNNSSWLFWRDGNGGNDGDAGGDDDDSNHGHDGT